MIKDKLRTLLNIRVKRELSASGPRPRVGRRITLGRIRMIVTSDLPMDLWVYLSLQGWREVTVTRDRRQYVDLPRESMEDLLTSEGTEREHRYRQLLRRAARARAAGQAERPAAAATNAAVTSAASVAPAAKAAPLPALASKKAAGAAPEATARRRRATTSAPSTTPSSAPSTARRQA